MSKANMLEGLVVNAPDSQSIGVIVSAVRQNKTVSQVTIITQSCDVVIAKIRMYAIGVGYNIEYLDYTVYSPTKISEAIKGKY